MKTFGLIGFPLSHSFSASYFSEKFKRENIRECEYLNFPIDTITKLPFLLDSHPQLKGLNVTIPYKEQVVPFLHVRDQVVKDTGACNCIKIEGKRLHGFNTDVAGFEISLKKQLDPADKKALILGTGGASKAVAYVLKKLSIDFLFVSREIKPNAITYNELTDLVIQTHTLIVNTTPAGMYPNYTAIPPLKFDAIGQNHYLYDLIYNPPLTKFLEKGVERKARISNGLSMLEIQAEESWKIWIKAFNAV